MTKGFLRLLVVLVIVFCVLGIVSFVFFPLPWSIKKNRGEGQPRIVIPRNPGSRANEGDSQNALLASLNNEAMVSRIPLNEGEVIISVLNGSFDGSPYETQFVAYRNGNEIDSPIYITYIDFNESARAYRRVWSAPTAATRPGTISLDTMDLLGDRSVCVILTGVNSVGEHTITVFRKDPARSREAAAGNRALFSKIAELSIDGTIGVREAIRSQAYQMGYSRGDSFVIAGYSRNFDSKNILDQVEIIYTYNPGTGEYEQSKRTLIPGAQVEQRRVRELLGDNRAFEEFISGLWYHMTPQGTIDRYQYIYFDPPNKEIIFYGDGTQQVFEWKGSSATRYGLYIYSQNISISTLRRSVNIELESLESVRVKVVEDVRLKVGVNVPWDGSYRKARAMEHQEKPRSSASAYIDALYDGSIGKIHFYSNGSYELDNRMAVKEGKYAFFFINNQEYLELRSGERNFGGASDFTRDIYMVEPKRGAAENRKTITLNKVKIGSRGVETLQEGPISLTLASEN